ncbi:MAG: glycosyl hydrolase family protein [Ignavibacteriales bacterium]|nr:MAG: glycosyl hydrolase family protein [Ignavibacteriales bacterium]
MKAFLLFFILTILFSSHNSLIAKDYKGAEYRTKDTYLYGRFEVRMKSAHREGMLASFFTYFDGTGIWNEIDLEIMGRYDDDVQFNVIAPTQSNHVGHVPMSSSPHQNYHIYAFEWTPAYVSWFVDGVEVLKQTGSHIQTLTQAQKIMMNIWNPQYENWAGKFYPEALPAFAFYDWVSYYTYTPGSGNYGTDNNFTFSWIDNFDSWDTTKWDKATHTFPGNNCDFIQENAVFRDGKLILCLTNNTNLGYQDIQAPSILWARAYTNKVEIKFSEEVDEIIAETISNYLIPNVTINSAMLLSDLKTVELDVTGINLNQTYTLIVYTMKDIAVVPNIMGLRSKSIILTEPLVFPVKINCGGPAVLDYLPDKAFSENGEYGYLDGASSAYPLVAISGTTEDSLYQFEHYGAVKYAFRVPNGSYSLFLMFAENFLTASNSRIFDVYVENNRVIENLDIYSVVGQNAAHQVFFSNVLVTDGLLEIHFAGKVNEPVINGIAIYANSSGILDDDKNIPGGFKVEQNYPNPFNGKTIINYSLNSTDNLSFELYNILGERIFYRDLGFIQPGNYKFELDTTALIQSPLTSGIYFYVFTGLVQRQSKKLVLLN